MRPGAATGSGIRRTRRTGIGPAFAPRRARHGFTLLEICTVLFIILILLGVMMPAMQSVFVEQDLRNDSQQLSLMVKTAMYQSGDQHRTYVIDLTSTNLALHPAGVPSRDADTASPASPAGDDATAPAQEDVEINRQLDTANKLLVPDPEKANAWTPMSATSWVFEPGHLCPATKVRVTRGEAWIEMNFNALTGNVENEASYLP
jgi:prepilin-type N-terminal cleavage/methylation domain-containing protein